MPGLAALLWSKLPGESDGICGGETTYLFSRTRARRLTSTARSCRQRGRQLAAPPTFRQLDADAVTASWCAGRGPERYDPGLSLAVTR
jgi:hypothetical protein